MQTALPLLTGMLLGILLTRWLITASHHHALRSYHADGQYEPARRAVVRHLRVNGTLNLTQFERMMDIGSSAALVYLDRMVQDGLLKQQGHRDTGVFYTRA